MGRGRRERGRRVATGRASALHAAPDSDEHEGADLSFSRFDAPPRARRLRLGALRRKPEQRGVPRGGGPRRERRRRPRARRPRRGERGLRDASRRTPFRHNGSGSGGGSRRHALPGARPARVRTRGTWTSSLDDLVADRDRACGPSDGAGRHACALHARRARDASSAATGFHFSFAVRARGARDAAGTAHGEHAFAGTRDARHRSSPRDRRACRAADIQRDCGNLSRRDARS